MSRFSAGSLLGAVDRRLTTLADDRVVQRIWERDPTVWGGTAATPELRDRLGWLTVADHTAKRVDELTRLAADVQNAFDRVVVLGMGGSSLAPEVLTRSFGRQDGYPQLDVLDGVHPVAVEHVEQRGDVKGTLFVVASKSGTTLETMRLYEYFWERTGENGSQFVAITDPGTPLASLGTERGFRAVFENPTDVGGRYAALSLFGMVPAALMGLDVSHLLAQGALMADACQMEPAGNPGAKLGALIGEAAFGGRDKLTLSMDPSIRWFGLWMEQLIAESTGKDGKGIVPIADEDLREPPRYADDRLFLTMTLEGTRDSGTLLGMRAIEEQGHPVERLELDDRYSIGAEFFRWEFASAVVGHLLGVNPFDQPDVEQSKVIAKRLIELGGAPTHGASDADVRRLLDGVKPGDYVALLAFCAPSSAVDRRLTAMQTQVRQRVGAAVSVGYGPRYLHSTGQLHKGGPPTGHFIQIVDTSQPALPIAGAAQRFGHVVSAQAAGDLEALAARGRPAVCVHGLDVLEVALR